MANPKDVVRNGNRIEGWSEMDVPLLLVNIQAIMPSLKPAQKKVARYIIENFSALEGMKSKVLAKKSGVSEPTVTRFVKKLGYENYRWFQLDIAKTDPATRKTGYSRVSLDDTVEGVCNKIVQDNLRVLSNLAQIIDSRKIEEAAQAITQAKGIYIFSQGRSVVTANSLRHRLSRLGINCTICNDPHEMAVVSSLAREEDLAIGISTYGRTKDVIRAIERVKGNGCRVIGITCYKGVPLEEYSDIVLYGIDVEPLSFGYEPTGATVSQIVLLDCVYMVVAQRMEEDSSKAFQVSYDALLENRV